VAEYPLDQASIYPVAEIAAAWERERPGTTVSSIAIVTPVWRLAKLLADDRRRMLSAAGVDGATLDLLGARQRADRAGHAHPSRSRHRRTHRRPGAGPRGELVSVLSAEQQTQLAGLLGVLLDQVTDPRPRTASQPLDG
jgi:hypothetical protein